MENYNIFDDYESFKQENLELITGLVKIKSKTISRFAPVLAVVDYLDSLHQKNQILSDDEIFIFSTGFDYIYDQFLYIGGLLKQTFNNNIKEMEKYAININLLLYINEFQAEALNYDDSKVKKNLKELDSLEESILDHIEKKELIPDEYFALLNDICDKMFTNNNIEIHTVDQIFYEIAIEYGIYEDDDYDIYNFVINNQIAKNRK